MLHKMLIFKHGIDFSSVRRPTLFPTLFPEEEGIPCTYQQESIPTGIDSEIGNQILESSPKFIFVQKFPLWQIGKLHLQELKARLLIRGAHAYMKNK